LCRNQRAYGVIDPLTGLQEESTYSNADFGQFVRQQHIQQLGIALEA
jgi:hypothetical protein